MRRWGATSRSWRPSREKNNLCQTRSWRRWCPGGSLAILLEDDGRHALLQSLKIVPINCVGRMICIWFVLLWKSSLAMAKSGATVWILTSSQSSDPAGSMIWTSALFTRGRLAFRHDLVRNEHSLLSGRSEACLPGKLCQKASDAFMSPGVEAFGAASSVATTWIQYLRALFAPWGGSSTSLFRA